jgi:hypothetical protein
LTDQESLYAWEAEVARQMPHVSGPQARVLALWSVGMVLAKSCALTAVTDVLSELLHVKRDTLRQRLREFCYAAEDKRGAHRRQLEVETAMGSLLGWVLRRWGGRALALALDATSLSDRFVVLTISVLYRGCAIPVAWRVVEAHAKASWNAHWLRLLERLAPEVPPDMSVLVLTDRGLYSRDIFRAICRLGFHPLMRVTRSGLLRPEGARVWRELVALVPAPGTSWSGRGTAFKNTPLRCTVVAWWEAGQEQPWLLVTDLEPDEVSAAQYALRAWIEQGFRAIKRGVWQWQRTRMTDPDRVERLWLALAVASLWGLSVGTQREDAPEAWELACSASPAGRPSRPRRRSGTRRRALSLLRRGVSAICGAIVQHRPLPLGWLLPDPWPRSSPPQLASGP